MGVGEYIEVFMLGGGGGECGKLEFTRTWLDLL